MGKRGPAPRGEYAGKSQVLSTRIRPDTRKFLTDAAAASGRSLSQEIEHRLRRSFIEDDKITSTFGNRRNYRLMQVIAITVGELYRKDDPTGAERDWLDDPVLFQQAEAAVTALLSSLRPPPSNSAAPSTAAPSNDWVGETLRSPVVGLQKMALTFDAIQNADPALPLDRGSRRQHLAALMKGDLGDLADRVNVVRLTPTAMQQGKGDRRKPRRTNRS
jgi:hypothetical protein